MSNKRLKDYTVRAVERAVRILSSFDGEHAERGVSEIAQATGLHKATAYRIIMTFTSPARLQEELEVVRQRGYALDDEEFEVGICAVAVPIRDIEGNVIAHISMPGPTNRLTPERIPEIAEALMETANAVSAHVWRE